MLLPQLFISLVNSFSFNYTNLSEEAFNIFTCKEFLNIFKVVKYDELLGWKTDRKGLEVHGEHTRRTCGI